MDANSIPFINDWNEDGKKDLIVGQSGEYGGTDNVRVYLNTGTNPAPVFSNYTAITSAGSPINLTRACPAVYDLDRDNLKDLIVGEYNGYVWFFKNIGTNAAPVFNSSEQLRLQSGTVIEDIANPRVHFNDWTGDGDLDMLIGDYGVYDGNIRLYENTTDVGVGEQLLKPVIKNFLILTPNPVVDQAVLKYSLDKSTLVRLAVFSVDGRYTASLINRYEERGKYEFVWDLCDGNWNKLPAGVYIVRLETEHYKQVLRVIIAR